MACCGPAGGWTLASLKTALDMLACRTYDAAFRAASGWCGSLNKRLQETMGKTMGRRSAWRLLPALLVVVCCSCESSQMSATGGDGRLYTRYNLHYVTERGKNKGSYANWTQYPGHDFVPYNSKLRVEPTGRRIYFITNDNMRIEWEFNPDRMMMSSREYVNLIMSPTPVSYEGLSDVDRQGITAGMAMVGMSKQGVLVALGYPAKHRTPSLEQNRWVYWKGRHNYYVVEFDESGNVAAIVN
jgi:hypothetical protein